MSQIDDDLARLQLPPEPEGNDKPRKSWVLLAVFVLALAGALAVVLLARSRPASVSLVDAELRTRWSDAVLLICTGHVEPQARSFATALSPGRIAKLITTAGQDVAKDGVVAMLDARLLDTAVADAKASVLATRARVRASRRALAHALKQKNEVDRIALAQANLRAAIAEEKAATTRLASSKIALQHAAVRATIKGRVWKMLVSEGQNLSDSTLQVAEVVDLSTLFVDADVAEAKLGKIKVGMDADVLLDAFEGRHFDAKVVAIKDEIDRAASTGVVRLQLIAPGPEVILGMAARVSFLARQVPLSERTQGTAVFIPKAAVVDRDGKTFVFLYTQGTATRVPVELGMQQGDDIETVSGVKPGSRLVTRPPSNLQSGDRVELTP